MTYFILFLQTAILIVIGLFLLFVAVAVVFDDETDSWLRFFKRRKYNTRYGNKFYLVMLPPDDISSLTYTIQDSYNHYLDYYNVINNVWYKL
jgi:hypothetical protein